MNNRQFHTIGHVQSPAPVLRPANDTLPVSLWTEMKERWLGGGDKCGAATNRPTLFLMPDDDDMDGNDTKSDKSLCWAA